VRSREAKDYAAGAEKERRMKRVGDKRVLFEIRHDINGHYFECEWDDGRVNIVNQIEQACKHCQIPSADILVEVQPLDSQAKSADARVFGKNADTGRNETQLECVRSYLLNEKEWKK
jgi:hypothetical protein